MGEGQEERGIVPLPPGTSTHSLEGPGDQGHIPQGGRGTSKASMPTGSEPSLHPPLHGHPLSPGG